MQLVTYHYKKLLLALFLVLFTVLNHLPMTQKVSSDYINDALQRSLVSFAVAKSLNAVISVAQGTEIAATPAGLGVNFAVGEALDPINDMVERFSWVMLASSVSLGIQKLLVTITHTFTLQLILTLFVLLFFILYVRKANKGMHLALKGMLFVLVLRFSMPLIALANEGVYQVLLSPSYKEAMQQLQATTEHAQQLKEQKEEMDPSLWSKIKAAVASTANTLNIKKKLQALGEKLEESFNHILTLITLFIVSTILFPLLFLYLFIRLLQWVWLPSHIANQWLSWLEDKTKLPTKGY